MVESVGNTKHEIPISVFIAEIPRDGSMYRSSETSKMLQKAS